ncbi:flavodoxin family protein [Candidatus Hodarchaeum mangrovi]
MKVLIVYDSVHGNTEQIAQVMGKALNSEMDVKVVKGNEVKTDHLTGLNLLIVGSPTHGGRYTELIQKFFKDKKLSIKDINVAAFDTRTSSTGITGAIEKVFGRAAVRIADSLKKKGGILLIQPEGFIVEGIKGPLKEGELERAETWVKKLVEKSKSVT